MLPNNTEVSVIVGEAVGMGETTADEIHTHCYSEIFAMKYEFIYIWAAPPIGAER